MSESNIVQVYPIFMMEEMHLIWALGNFKLKEIKILTFAAISCALQLYLANQTHKKSNLKKP